MNPFASIGSPSASHIFRASRATGRASRISSLDEFSHIQFFATGRNPRCRLPARLATVRHPQEQFPAGCQRYRDRKGWLQRYRWQASAMVPLTCNLQHRSPRSPLNLQAQKQLRLRYRSGDLADVQNPIPAAFLENTAFSGKKARKRPLILFNLDLLRLKHWMILFWLSSQNKVLLQVSRNTFVVNNIHASKTDPVSTSPYRRNSLVALACLSSCQSETDETPLPDEAPPALARAWLRSKGARGGWSLPGGADLGSDQVATVDSKIYGKPGTHERAVAQLRALSGKTVNFSPPFACSTPPPVRPRCVASDTGQLPQLSDDEIEAYPAA